MDSPANAQSSYSVIFFPGENLPDEYRSIVFANWLRSLRQGNHFFELIDADIYFETYGEYIKRIIARPHCLLRMAVLSDDHDVVLGWSCMEEKTLHYAYVRQDYRRHGIGQALTASGFSVVTHVTRGTMKLWEEKYKHLIFNPFI